MEKLIKVSILPTKSPISYGENRIVTDGVRYHTIKWKSEYWSGLIWRQEERVVNKITTTGKVSTIFGVWWNKNHSFSQKKISIYYSFVNI